MKLFLNLFLIVSITITTFKARSQSQDFNNGNLENVNALWINDPGPEEGVKWLGTVSNWSIDVTPEDRSNNDGNLNFYGTSGNIISWRTMKLKGNTSNLIVEGNGNSYFLGNVGIGTPTPHELLDVKGNIYHEPGFFIKSGISTPNNFTLYRPVDARVLFETKLGTSVYGGYEFITNSTTKLIIKGDGYVGVGTTTPHELLDVNGNIYHEPGFFIKSGISTPNNFTLYRPVDARVLFETKLGTSVYGGYEFITNSTTKLIIKGDGNVGIGTTETGTHKLAVDGTIGAREIIVEAGTWSDFVFNKDYKLKDLEDVENFIEENKHLPDVPSEKEVLENGVALGEMDAKLLQKIEELTLYMIEQNKKTEKLIEKVEIIESENKELKEKITKLETLE